MLPAVRPSEITRFWLPDHPISHAASCQHAALTPSVSAYGNKVVEHDGCHGAHCSKHLEITLHCSIALQRSECPLYIKSHWIAAPMLGIRGDRNAASLLSIKAHRNAALLLRCSRNATEVVQRMPESANAVCSISICTLGCLGAIRVAV